MEKKKINFSTGDLIINDTSISFQLHYGSINEVNTIGRENIGHTELQDMKVLESPEMVYSIRLGIISIIVVVVGVLVSIFNNTSPFLIYIGFLLMLFALFIYFATFWLDAIFGFNVARPVLSLFFGVDATRVVVQNIYGGNNLHFFILQDEKTKLPKFEDYKLDKVYKTESTNSTAPIQEQKSSNLDELKKLGELFQNGILTKDEFEKKKTELLNK